MAGLLEGEGCFSLQWGNRTSSNVYPRVEVKCNMTDEDVIRRLAKICGGRVRGPICKRSPTTPVAKPQWIWHVGRKAGMESLLGRLLPHMGLRRSAKIREILDALAKYPARGTWKHGTRQGYEKGCRCTECKSANTERHRRRRKRVMSRLDIAGYAACGVEVATEGPPKAEPDDWLYPKQGDKTT